MLWFPIWYGGRLGRIDQRRQYNEAKKIKIDKVLKNVLSVCDMSDRYVEFSGTPVVVFRRNYADLWLWRDEEKCNF